MRRLLVAILLSGAAAAQPSVSVATVAAVAAVPHGAFAEDAGPAGGMSVGAYVDVPGSPAAVGLEGMVATRGTERRDVPYRHHGVDRWAGVSTTSGLAQRLAVLRLQRPRSALDARVRDLAGAEADHVAPHDVVHYGDGTVRLLVQRTRTDLVVPHFGAPVSL